jgi:hypothetical protein
MTATRKVGVFAIVFAVAYPIIYIVCTEMNWAAFTYHAAIGQFAAGPAKPIAGPAMYWYGWITTAAIAAGTIAAIAAWLPGDAMKRLPAATAWVVPCAAIVTACGLMIKMYFFR